LLEPGVDYEYLQSDVVVTGFELLVPVPAGALKTLAVRYTRPDDVVIGGSYSSYGITAAADTLMLEMIKAPDPRPSGPYATTWRLAMRNVYNLGVQNIPAGSFTLMILDNISPPFARPGSSALTYNLIFGIDSSGSWDGHVDAKWLDLVGGRLWFPDRHAFAPDPANVATWTGGEFEFTGPYQAQYDQALRIYNDYLNPTDENDVHQYTIMFTRTIPAD
ncbi:MAG TPA: hypothetical protein VFX92_13270, partial [Candidatus Krumholzibacteria bacterium]|nr:hypothetical protein [Candidatus Krumholzibacteria bacterium]